MSAPLAFASQQLVIYAGSFLFIAGIIGGPLVILVFLSLRTFRQSSCALYLAIMSSVNILHLFTGLLTFMMINGFMINWLNRSIFYCKFRLFLVQWCVLLSLTCMCFAVIDQFLATCFNPRWHRWSNIKVARYMIIGTIGVMILHGIPILIYNNHVFSPLTGRTYCVFTNTIYQKYFNTVYYLVLITALPLTVMTIVGLLAYRNVQQIAYRTVPLVRREQDKQLTTMVLVQVFSDVLFILPGFIFSCYSTIISVQAGSSLSIEFGFVSNIMGILYYWHFVVRIIFLDMPIITMSICIIAEPILHLCVCIKTIPSTIDLCFVHSSFQSMVSSKNHQQSNSAINMNKNSAFTFYFMKAEKIFFHLINRPIKKIKKNASLFSVAQLIITL